MSRLIFAYRGPLFRLERVSDGNLKDIYGLPDGRPNLAEVQSWLNGASYCYLVKRYDQLGSGNDEAQTTAANKPLFTLDSAVRGKYGIVFDQATKTLSWLDIPSAVTGDGKATSIVEVVSCASSNAATTGIAGASETNAGTLTLLTGGNADNKFQVLTSAAFLTVTNARSRSQPQVNTVTSGASNIKVYQDNNAAQTLSANTAGTWVGGKTGALKSGFQMNGLHFAKIIYPSELSANDVATIHNFLYPVFDIVTNNTAQIIWPGHSGIQGTGATLLKNIQFYVEPLLNRRVNLSNQGKFGQTANQIYTARTKYAAEFNSAFSKNIIFGADPANDILNVAAGSITGYGTTAWTSYVLPFIQAMQTAGHSVIQQTMIPLQWPDNAVAREAERVAYNTLVRNNAATYGYTLYDADGLSQLQDIFSIYFSGDHVHLSNLGYATEAPLAAATINSLLQ